MNKKICSRKGALLLNLMKKYSILGIIIGISFCLEAQIKVDQQNPLKPLITTTLTLEEKSKLINSKGVVKGDQLMECYLLINQKEAPSPVRIIGLDRGDK